MYVFYNVIYIVLLKTFAVEVYRCIKCLMEYCFNSLRAKFFGENIKVYLHFMSFLHTDMP